MRRFLGFSLGLFLAIGVYFASVGKPATKRGASRSLSISTLAQTRTSLKGQNKPGTRSDLTQAYAQLPLSFEPNLGQTNADARFIAHGPGYELFLTPRDVVMLMRAPGDTKALSAHSGDRLWLHDFGHAGGGVLRMRMLGANQVSRLVGLGELTGKTNYLIGNQPSKWHTGIPNYRQVSAHGIYPGIDLVYYGTQRQLEYDFVINPAADPHRIRLALQGAQRLQIDPRGDLVATISGGEVRFYAPIAYQKQGDVKKFVDASYKLEDADTVAFNLGEFDPRKSSSSILFWPIRPISAEAILTAPTELPSRVMEPHSSPVVRSRATFQRYMLSSPVLAGAATFPRTHSSPRLAPMARR